MIEQQSVEKLSRPLLRSVWVWTRCTHLSFSNTCVSSPTEKITFESAPSPQEFNEGDDANIICKVSSSPVPFIRWKHKGSKIRVDTDGEPNTKMFQCLSSHLQLASISPPIEITSSTTVCPAMPSNPFAALFLLLFLPPII